MFDGTDRLRKICEANSRLNSIFYLKKFVKAQDLEKLCQMEHFDLVLCFHVLHHVADWRTFFANLLRLGDYVVIETPPVNDGFVHLKPTIPEIARYLQTLPFGEKIGSFARQSPEIKDHMILFTSQQPKRKKPLDPTISIETFLQFNGVYPKLD
jgi:hypothetical protein